MPELKAEQRAAGGWVARPDAPPYDADAPATMENMCGRVLPTPDQSRYGPPGTTDSPRFHSDGVTRLPSKGDTDGD